MRRLQDLVDRATGLDASDGEEDDDVAMPSTMQSKKSSDRHHERKKIKKEKEKGKGKQKKSDVVPTTGQESLAPAPPASDPPEALGRAEKRKTHDLAPSAAAAISSSPTAADDWEEVDDEDDGVAGKTPTTKDAAGGKRKGAHADEEAEADTRTAAQAEEEKKRKKEEKRKLRQQQQRQMQAEEDALLDAVLAHHAGAQPNATEGGSNHPHNRNSSSSPGSPNTAASSPTGEGYGTGAAASSAAPSDAASLEHFVMACDPHQLDTRLERLRMFGADAVEDVGDGRTPHRRADGRVRDSGTVSFFPPHHAHVKFVQSAFATPNRYRWVPYDSLGVYLTTEDGRSGMDYTLNCESNAFQRALAQLRACQERMGGVQDLVECLARNKVYHIPTLLQCVYAMEATGESAFAGELLDVALYQVGVILRRFTLSGTWTQRRLPMARGGNGLLFQTLQRGVHAALKRGCLRTAFERTRCLLSLDPRDPCGMLLLLDYTALRAKRWVWLLEMRHRVLAATGSGSDSALASFISALPNYAFSWALAKHFIEREEKLQHSSSTDSRPSKVLRGITEAQRAALTATPAAEEMIATALTRFPHAAVRLVNALGGVETVCGGGDDLPVSDSSIWFGDIVERAEDVSSGDAHEQQRRVAELFVARHEELWKLNECISVLRSAVRALVQTPKGTVSAAMDGSASPRPSALPSLDPHAYLDLTQEAVLGVSVAPIPAELLRPDVADLAGGEGEGMEMDANMVEELIRMLRAHRANGAGDDATTREYLQQLEAELGERARRGGGGGGGVDAPQVAQGAAEGSDADGDSAWYAYDEGDLAEWYSVASAEDRDSDEGAEEPTGESPQ